MSRVLGRQVHAIEYTHADGRDYRHAFKKGTHLVTEPDGAVSIRSTRGRSWDRFLQRDGQVKPFLVNPRGKVAPWMAGVKERERAQAKADRAAQRFALVKWRGDGRYGSVDRVSPKDYRSRAAAEKAADKLNKLDAWGGNVVVREPKYFTNPKGRSMRTNAGGVRVVFNRLLGGWYVVTGPHQTPISGRFDSRADAQQWLRDRQFQRDYPKTRTNPRGGRVTMATRKRKARTSRKAKATRKRRTIPAHVRRAGGWAAYMASIRPGGKMARRKRSKRARASAPRRRRRRRSVALAAPRRRAVRRRRTYRRNPFGLQTRGGIVGQVIQVTVQGAKDGAVGTLASGVARFARGKLALEGNTPVGIAAEVGLGVVQAIVARRMFGPDVARAAAQGVFQAVITTAVKGAGVPLLSPALGDEGELPLLSGIYDLGDVYPGMGAGNGTLPLISGTNELSGVGDVSGVNDAGMM